MLHTGIPDLRSFFTVLIIVACLPLILFAVLLLLFLLSEGVTAEHGAKVYEPLPAQLNRLSEASCKSAVTWMDPLI
jgi:hypothetical protein